MRTLFYTELPLTNDPRQVFTVDVVIDGIALHARMEIRYLSALDQWVMCHSERSEESPRPMLTPSGLMAVPKEGLPEAVRITEADLTDVPAFAGGSLHGVPSLMILSATVAGWRPGQTVDVEYKNIRARGIVKERSVDADTGDGAWKCELLSEVISG